MLAIIALSVLSVVVFLVTFILTARHHQRIIATLRGEIYLKADKAFMDGWDQGAHFVLTSTPEAIKAMQDQPSKD